MTRTSACSWFPSGDRRGRGFTLLEILLVLTILGMASIVVVPNLGGLEVRTFSARVREATSLLNYARRTAVVSGQPAVASFLVTATGQSADGFVDPRTVAGSWQADDISITFEDSTEQETRIDERLDVTFYPEGGSTGGILHLRVGDRQASIAVDPFSGRVLTEFPDD